MWHLIPNNCGLGITRSSAVLCSPFFYALQRLVQQWPSQLYKTLRNGFSNRMRLISYWLKEIHKNWTRQRLLKVNYEEISWRSYKSYSIVLLYSICQNQGTPLLYCLAHATRRIALSCHVLLCLAWQKIKHSPYILMTVSNTECK